MAFAQQFDPAHTVDDHVTHAKIRKAARADRDSMRQIGSRVAQILYLAGKLLRIPIDQNQFVGYALHSQRIRNVRAHMPKTNHTKTSFLAHIKHILSYCVQRVLV